jgi:hypothetical protein
MMLALLLVFVLFGRLAVSVVMLALGVATELAVYALQLLAFVLRRLVWPVLRQLVRGPRSAPVPARWMPRSESWPVMGSLMRPVKHPRWWGGPQSRSAADFGSLIRGIEAARGLPHDPHWDRG